MGEKVISGRLTGVSVERSRRLPTKGEIFDRVKHGAATKVAETFQWLFSDERMLRNFPGRAYPEFLIQGQPGETHVFGDSMSLDGGILIPEYGKNQPGSLSDMTAEALIRRGFPWTGVTHALPGSYAKQVLAQVEDNKTRQHIIDNSKDARQHIVVDMGGNDFRDLVVGEQFDIALSLVQNPFQRQSMHLIKAYLNIKKGIGDWHKKTLESLYELSRETKEGLAVYVMLPPAFRKIQDVAIVEPNQYVPRGTVDMKSQPLLPAVSHAISASVINEVTRSMRKVEKKHPDFNVRAVPSFGVEQDFVGEHVTRDGQKKKAGFLMGRMATAVNGSMKLLSQMQPEVQTA